MAARADVVAVVSSKNPLSSLSKNEIADIFLGKRLRFPDGEQAVPIDQEPGAVARTQFYTTIVGKTEAQLKAHWSKVIFTGRGKPPPAVADSDAVKKLLAANPLAIGYIERSLVDSTVKVLSAP
jgi:ABC-type phosphate transport system substrate-binding protein